MLDRAKIEAALEEHEWHKSPALDVVLGRLKVLVDSVPGWTHVNFAVHHRQTTEKMLAMTQPHHESENYLHSRPEGVEDG